MKIGLGDWHVKVKGGSIIVDIKQFSYYFYFIIYIKHFHFWLKSVCFQ